MLEHYIGQRPVISYLKFSHHYSKLDRDQGTTIRLGLKDENNHVRTVGDVVWMIHQPKIKFKAEITKIEVKKIIDIDFSILEADVAPFPLERHLDFLKLIQSFYDFPLTMDMKFHIIYWRRIE